MLMKKFKIFADPDKEEIWLNEMSQKGYALGNYTFMTYYFEECEPNEYTYRIQLLDQSPTHEKSKEYFAFVKELDVEVVASYFRWVYFRKKTDLGIFEIHSDAESKIKHYKSIITLQGVVGLSNLVIAFSNISIGSFNHLNNMNQNLGFINLAIALLLGNLCYRNYKKILKLKSEHILHE